MPSRRFLVEQACLTVLGNLYPDSTPQRAARRIDTGFREGWWYAAPFLRKVRQEYRRLVQIHGEESK